MNPPWLVSDMNGTLRPETQEERERFEAADDDTEQFKQGEQLA